MNRHGYGEDRSGYRHDIQIVWREIFHFYPNSVNSREVNLSNPQILGSVRFLLAYFGSIVLGSSIEPP
jgi:hypothetical protein